MRSVDPQSAARLRALFATSAPFVYRRPWPLLALLLLIPVLFVASQPLPWHHDMVPGAGYHVVYGYTRSWWVLIVGAVAIAVFVRLARRPVTSYVVVALLALTGATAIAMYTDWANSYTQARSLNLDPYNGPGFLLAVAGLAGLVAAAGAAWYARATSSAA
jgi:hypothetical protein